MWLRAFSLSVSCADPGRCNARPAECPSISLCCGPFHLVPVSACYPALVTATSEIRPPVVTTQNAAGIFQVMADPVSTWVQEMCERSPRQSPRLVTKL